MGQSGSSRAVGRFWRIPILYAIVTVIAVLGRRLLGDTWWLQPFTLFTFWWTLPGVVLVGVALLVGRRRAALFFAVPAAVWIWSYAGLFLPSAPPQLAPDIRVVSYNTYVHAPSSDSILDLIDRTSPDVLLLQEVFPAREEELRGLLAERYPHQEVAQSPGVGGVVVLSRHPIVERRDVDLTEPGARDTMVVMLDVDGRRLQVVSVHLTSPCPTCGPSMIERLDLEGQRRPAELAAVLHALQRGVPAVVGGDFNSTDRSQPYRLLTRAGFVDPHRMVGRGPGFTWPNDRLWFPILRVDWVLVRGMQPVASWVDDGGESDHRPVVVDLSFPES